MEARLTGYRERRAWTVWHIAALGKSETLPELSDLTGVRGRDGMSDEQIAHNARRWIEHLAPLEA